MPSIITAPTRTRSSRGMTSDDALAYVELLDSLEDGNLVLVDDSATDDYEKSYAKGERVRRAIQTHFPDSPWVTVISFDSGDGNYVAGLKYNLDR